MKLCLSLATALDSLLCTSGDGEVGVHRTPGTRSTCRAANFGGAQLGCKVNRGDGE